MLFPESECYHRGEAYAFTECLTFRRSWEFDHAVQVVLSGQEAFRQPVCGDPKRDEWGNSGSAFTHMFALSVAGIKMRRRFELYLRSVDGCFLSVARLDSLILICVLPLATNDRSVQSGVGTVVS